MFCLITRYKEQHEISNTSTTSTANGVGIGLKKQTGGETPSSTIGIKRTSTDQVEGNSSATKRPRGVATGQVGESFELIISSRSFIVYQSYITLRFFLGKEWNGKESHTQISKYGIIIIRRVYLTK